MRQVALIAWHGFVQHATSRAFIFGLLLLPLYMVIGGLAPTASQAPLDALGGSIRHFAVIDKTGVMLPAIDAAIERDVTARGLLVLAAYADQNVEDKDRLRAEAPELALLLLDGDPQSEAAITAIEKRGGVSETFVELRPYLKADAPTFNAPIRRFFRVNLPEDIAASDDMLAAAEPYLAADKLIVGERGAVSLWAILHIPEGFLEGRAKATYITDDTNRVFLREVLREALDGELKRRRAEVLGVAREATDEVLAAAGTIETIDPDPERLGALSAVRQLNVIGAVVVYLLLFMAVFMTANMVVMALVEEKSNRVAELLLSCVRAETLMAGKLFTGLLLAFLLVVVWAGSAMFSIDTLFPTAKIVVENLTENLRDPQRLVMLVTFFSLAYLTVGSFFLAAGSAATSITDAQTIVAPATTISLPIFMLPIVVAYDPDGGLARFASYLPVFAPFTMMVRSLSKPEGIDILGALVVSVVTLWWMVRLVARVFRANLLRPDSTTTFTGFLRDLFGRRKPA
jgi:ABC-2 type transport system permease protein